jgi:hypothetical protein
MNTKNLNTDNKQKDMKSEKAVVAPFKVTGNWGESSKKLKVQFPQLTDADLKFDAGKESDLLSRIEKKLNKKHEEVVNIINKAQA